MISKYYTKLLNSISRTQIEISTLDNNILRCFSVIQKKEKINTLILENRVKWTMKQDADKA